VNNLPRVARGAERPGLEPATSQLQVRRLNHYATTPHKNNYVNQNITRRMAIANETCVSFCTFWPPLGTPLGKLLNVTWMERGFNACQTHRSMYPSIFNCFPVILPVSSKVRHFSTFWPPLGVRHWDNRGKCYMDGKRIHSMLVKRIPINLQSFTSYSEIATWSEIATFSQPLAFNAPVGVFPLEFREKVWSSEN